MHISQRSLYPAKAQTVIFTESEEPQHTQIVFPISRKMILAMDPVASFFYYNRVPNIYSISMAPSTAHSTASLVPCPLAVAHCAGYQHTWSASTALVPSVPLASEVVGAQRTGLSVGTSAPGPRPAGRFSALKCARFQNILTIRQGVRQF